MKKEIYTSIMAIALLTILGGSMASAKDTPAILHKFGESFDNNGMNLDRDIPGQELRMTKHIAATHTVIGTFHKLSRHEFGNMNWQGALNPVPDDSYRLTLSHSAALQGNVLCITNYCLFNYPSKSPQVNLPYSTVWYNSHEPVW